MNSYIPPAFTCARSLFECVVLTYDLSRKWQTWPLISKTLQYVSLFFFRSMQCASYIESFSWLARCHATIYGTGYPGEEHIGAIWNSVHRLSYDRCGEALAQFGLEREWGKDGVFETRGLKLEGSTAVFNPDYFGSNWKEALNRIATKLDSPLEEFTILINERNNQELDLSEISTSNLITKCKTLNLKGFFPHDAKQRVRQLCSDLGEQEGFTVQEVVYGNGSKSEPVTRAPQTPMLPLARQPNRFSQKASSLSQNSDSSLEPRRSSDSLVRKQLDFKFQSFEDELLSALSYLNNPLFQRPDSIEKVLEFCMMPRKGNPKTFHLGSERNIDHLIEILSDSKDPSIHLIVKVTGSIPSKDCFTSRFQSQNFEEAKMRVTGIAFDMEQLEAGVMDRESISNFLFYFPSFFPNLQYLDLRKTGKDFIPAVNETFRSKIILEKDCRKAFQKLVDEWMKIDRVGVTLPFVSELKNESPNQKEAFYLVPRTEHSRPDRVRRMLCPLNTAVLHIDCTYLGNDWARQVFELVAKYEGSVLQIQGGNRRFTELVQVEGRSFGHIRMIRVSGFREGSFTVEDFRRLEQVAPSLYCFDVPQASFDPNKLGRLPFIVLTQKHMSPEKISYWKRGSRSPWVFFTYASFESDFTQTVVLRKLSRAAKISFKDPLASSLDAFGQKLRFPGLIYQSPVSVKTLHTFSQETYLRKEQQRRLLRLEKGICKDSSRERTTEVMIQQLRSALALLCKIGFSVIDLRTPSSHGDRISSTDANFRKLIKEWKPNTFKDEDDETMMKTIQTELKTFFKGLKEEIGEGTPFNIYFSMARHRGGIAATSTIMTKEKGLIHYLEGSYDNVKQEIVIKNKEVESRFDIISVESKVSDEGY